MRWQDVTLLGKKIGVGILITLFPLAILTGGLWISEKTLKKSPVTTVNQPGEATHAN